MKLIHKIKEWFKRSHNADTKSELKEIEKYETEVTLDVTPVPKPAPKSKSNRKPGPKKQVPGQPSVKPSTRKSTQTGKPRTYNKPKPKKV